MRRGVGVGLANPAVLEMIRNGGPGSAERELQQASELAESERVARELSRVAGTQVSIHAAHRVVEIQTRRHLDITPSSTFLSFDQFKICYHAILGLELAPVFASLAGGGTPEPAPDSPPSITNREPV